MFAFLRRKRPITASEAGRLGNAVKRNRKREHYKRFHNEMAAKFGTKIEWAE